MGTTVKNLRDLVDSAYFGGQSSDLGSGADLEVTWGGHPPEGTKCHPKVRGPKAQRTLG
jgi:hypothetical protein